MQIIINAGGSGTRLWPLSTSRFPKQFVNLIDDENFVQKTFQRLVQGFETNQIWLSTNLKFAELALNSLPLDFEKQHLLLESEKRDTFASILAQTAVVAHFVGRNEPLIFIASDHLIVQKDWQKFNLGLRQMSNLVKNGNFELVIAGILPTFPNTELGYIEISKTEKSIENTNSKNGEKMINLIQNELENYQNSTQTELESLESQQLTKKVENVKSEKSQKEIWQTQNKVFLEKSENLSKIGEMESNETKKLVKNGEMENLQGENWQQVNQNLQDLASFDKMEILETKSLQVASFREKPDLQAATRFVESGDFLWNLGYFGWNFDIMQENLAKHWPELVPIVDQIYQKGEISPELYRQFPKNSIDFALVEKLSRIGAVQMNISWQDIGNWDIVKDFLPPIKTLDSKKNELEPEKPKLTKNDLNLQKLTKNKQIALETTFDNSDSDKNTKNQTILANSKKIDQNKTLKEASSQSQIESQIENQKSQAEISHSKNLSKNLKANEEIENIETSQNPNIPNPNIIQIDGDNNKIKSQLNKNRKIAFVGVSGLLIVESEEGLLIIDPKKAPLVKKAAEYFENLEK